MHDTWQWQLQGPLDMSYDVRVYDIDLIETSAGTIEALHRNHRRVICYVSVGSWERFRRDHAALPEEVLGEPLKGFRDERWLDIRRAAVRQTVVARFDLAAKRRCDGVEPDNVDGYANRTGFALTARDQLDFNLFLAAQAHRVGLAVGLKNDLAQVGDLAEHFDFAVNEQCHQFDECDALRPFTERGKPVFNAEYRQMSGQALESLCARAEHLGIHTLVLPVELDDARRVSCDR